MIANWKSVAVMLIGLAAFLWLGPRSDSGNAEIAQQVSAIAPGCGTHAGRCMVYIRFTYPAADLSVLVTTFTSEYPQTCRPGTNRVRSPTRT